MSLLLETETVTNIQNQGKRNEGTIKWKILYIQAKNYPNGVVLERAFIWGSFQRLSPLQKLSFSKVDTRPGLSNFFLRILHLIALQYVKFSSVKL